MYLSFKCFCKCRQKPSTILIYLSVYISLSIYLKHRHCTHRLNTFLELEMHRFVIWIKNINESSCTWHIFTTAHISWWEDDLIVTFLCVLCSGLFVQPLPSRCRVFLMDTQDTQSVQTHRSPLSPMTTDTASWDSMTKWDHTPACLHTHTHSPPEVSQMQKYPFSQFCNK